MGIGIFIQLEFRNKKFVEFVVNKKKLLNSQNWKSLDGFSTNLLKHHEALIYLYNKFENDNSKFTRV